MKSYFPDLNVWIAMAYEAHEHHPSARQWLEHLDEGTLHFCRFTQIGFLRLLTHPSVMRENVKTQQQAWETYDLLQLDGRVSFLTEPDWSELELTFRNLTSGVRASPKQWPDAYLAAFAASGRADSGNL